MLVVIDPYFNLNLILILLWFRVPSSSKKTTGIHSTAFNMQVAQWLWSSVVGITTGWIKPMKAKVGFSKWSGNTWWYRDIWLSMICTESSRKVYPAAKMTTSIFSTCYLLQKWDRSCSICVRCAINIARMAFILLSSCRCF